MSHENRGADSDLLAALDRLAIAEAAVAKEQAAFDAIEATRQLARESIVSEPPVSLIIVPSRHTCRACMYRNDTARDRALNDNPAEALFDGATFVCAHGHTYAETAFEVFDRSALIVAIRDVRVAIDTDHTEWLRAAARKLLEELDIIA